MQNSIANLSGSPTNSCVFCLYFLFHNRNKETTIDRLQVLQEEIYDYLFAFCYFIARPSVVCSR